VRYAFSQCPPDASLALQRALDIGRVTADVLVRRGLADPGEAREFLELTGSQHDPLALGDVESACAAIERAIAERRPIVVHGDYDVDGICATAVATAVLRALGGEVEPFLPSRFDEGYGVAVETVERLAAEGCRLLVTVDCGITATAAAARAAELGLELVITDHHRPAEHLPECPVVATHGRGDYPAELSGTGVAYKLAEALVARAGADPGILREQLDLVALATVADLVPLAGENRGLVRAGLDQLRRTARPGLEALMRVAKVERMRIGATEIGFRLAPRINAAGRLGHPREALELVTTTDPARARELADLLEARNRERQAIEAEILRQALVMADGLPAERRARRAVVLSSAEWHVGVIGIVASRVAERLGKPAVLIAVDGDEGRGSGRSIASFDLHAGLGACAGHLLAWGGHRAAAGLTIRADAIEAFADAFEVHATAVIAEEDLAPPEHVDAVVSLSEISLDLADELARLEPHGLGNPSVRLLVPGVAAEGVASLGQEGRHLRFTARSSAGACRVVLWSGGKELRRIAESGRVDVAGRVERNDWNGTSSVQIVARSVTEVPELAPAEGMCATPCDATCADRRRGPRSQMQPAAAAEHAVHDRRNRGSYAELVRLAAAGDGLLIVCADVSRRRAMLAGPLHPRRLGLDGAVLLSDRCADEALASRLGFARGRSVIGLTDYATLAAVAGAFPRVAALDPPIGAAQQAALDGAGEVHLVWGAAEVRAAVRSLEARAPRALCGAVWKALADGPAGRDELHDRIAALGHPPSPEDVDWAVAVLIEGGLVVLREDRHVRVPPDGDVDLDRVPAYAERLVGHRAALAAFAPEPAVAIVR
jgi:single-stranded-DNA-specific exonuclease